MHWALSRRTALTDVDYENMTPEGLFAKRNSSVAVRPV